MKKINLILLNLAGNLLFCVHNLKVSRLTFTNFVLLAALICLLASSANAQSSVGVKTDSGAYPEGSPPPLPAAGGKLTDPTFGTQIMRVTDSSDGAELRTEYSYWSTFNEDNTKMLVLNGNGSHFLLGFNPTTFTRGAKTLLPTVPPYMNFPDAIWSRLQTNVLLGRANAKIYAIDTTTMVYSLYTDMTSQLPANSYILQISISADDDVIAFTVKQNDTYALLGYGAWKRSTSEMYYVADTSFDEVQIDKSGRYLVVKTGFGSGEGAIEAEIVDLQVNPKTVVQLTDGAPDHAPGGHSDMGTGTAVGAANWSNSITFRSLATPHVFTHILSFGSNQTNYGMHLSFLANNEDWILISTYTTTGNARTNAFNNELIMVATDGSQRVKRFAHHYSWVNSYYDSPRANVSRDGKFVAFTSNWGNSGRQDLFIAKVPSDPVLLPSPTPSPTPTPTPTSTNAVFENVSGFSISGGNRLDKLSTPYSASADTAGVINTDGRFSYKYNTINNGRDVSVWLDDGIHTFKIANGAGYVNIYVDGVYQTDFSLDITKTIAIERIGSVVKIWEDNTLRYQSAPGASSGAADFKISCGGDSAVVGLGINNATITGISASN